MSHRMLNAVVREGWQKGLQEALNYRTFQILEASKTLTNHRCSAILKTKK